ncbi:MAG: hypothetical protein K6A23_05070 [Butyrivibrio sp.]|nr:hypothetical protein [Butyrivibrio sp.]
MSKVIYKSQEIKAVTLIVALIAIITIFPMRLWNVTKTSQAVDTTIVSESGIVNDTTDVVQKFVAEYDRIDSIDVYVTDLITARYMRLDLYDENMTLIYSKYVDLKELELPGYVNVWLHQDLEVGKTYTAVIFAQQASFKVAYETVSATPGYLGDLLYNDTTVEGYHLASRYNYTVPLDKKVSLALIAVIAALAVGIFFVTDIVAKKRGIENDKLVTVGKAFRCAANPAAAVFYGILIIMVFPLQLFDYRPIEIVFYLLGLIIAAALTFYGINHKPALNEEKLFDINIKNILMIVAISYAIGFGVEYMNALYTIFQTLAERKELISLLCVIILTFSVSELFNLYNLIYIVIAAVAGRRYYVLNALADTEKEYDLNNSALLYAIIIAVLGGFIVLNFIRLIVNAIRKKVHGQKLGVYPTPAGLLTIVLFAALIIMRNTRWWGVVLVITFTAFYIRFMVWEDKDKWTGILSGGMILNFLSSVIYCLLHRYYQAYREARFAFTFHTATVTAEYLTAMEVMAIVLLLMKLKKLEKGAGLKKSFALVWKEWVLVGIIGVYALFTISRTAFLAIGAACFVVFILHSTVKSIGKNIIALVSALVILFPAVFTMQRLIPVMVGQPDYFDVEDVAVFAKGGTNWDNLYIMYIERYWIVFKDKIFSAGDGTNKYHEDRNNYDENGVVIYTDNGVYVYPTDRYWDETSVLSNEEIIGSATYKNESDEYNDICALSTTLLDSSTLIASSGLPGDLLVVLASDIEDTDESAVESYANGRFAIFRSYISQLNMTGHAEMGAELESGEIAVHAHNIYLQVAYDHGIPVGIIFALWVLTVIISGIWYSIKCYNEQKVAGLPIAITIGFAVAGLTEWLFQFSNPVTIMLMLALAPIMFRFKKA